MRHAPKYSSSLQRIDEFNHVPADCFLFDPEKATDKSGAFAGREERKDRAFRQLAVLLRRHLLADGWCALKEIKWRDAQHVTDLLQA